MKVLYNANSLLPPLAGVGTYTRQLGREMQTLGEIEEVCHFIGQECSDYEGLAGLLERTLAASPRGWPWHKLALHALLLRFSLRQVLNGIYRHAPLLNGALTHALEVLEARRRTESVGDFLYHETNFVLKPHPGPRVVTIHDLGVFHSPQFHPRDRVHFLSSGIRHSVENADQIITDSEYVRRELLERYPLAEGRVTAIPLAAADSYRPRGESECAATLANYGLSYGAFLLLVGSVEPRKNLALLLAAYDELPEDMKAAFPIVHVGPSGWSNSHINARIDDLARNGRFRSLGYVAEDDLPDVVAAAAGLAFPSLYEGFGLPPLEAMASGIPVLAGNSSSIPEVVGQCGILVDPHSRAALTAGLEKLLAGGSEVSQMARGGVARAGEFSWARTARLTFDVYRKAQRAG